MELIEAWKLAAVGDAWELVIAGPDEKGFKRTVQQKIEANGLSSSVSFTGPLDDQAKWQAYRNAELFVLPSFNENFGIVIAEAMAAELPVLTTTGTPWRCLQENEMGWWVNPTPEKLSLALAAATMESADSLAIKGQKSRSYVLEIFLMGSNSG
ncbi:MAG: glycosyltransferase [Pirellulales bacterium]